MTVHKNHRNNFGSFTKNVTLTCYQVIFSSTTKKVCLESYIKMRSAFQDFSITCLFISSTISSVKGLKYSLVVLAQSIGEFIYPLRASFCLLIKLVYPFVYLHALLVVLAVIQSMTDHITMLQVIYFENTEDLDIIKSIIAQVCKFYIFSVIYI